MVEEKILELLNSQFNDELFSSYQYLEMSAYFESINFSGFSNWMKIQSEEEYMHAMKFYNYILQVEGRIKFAKIDAPKGGWESIKDVFENVYKHEQGVTKSIYELVELAHSQKDFATHNFLQWFVSEQIEEEATSLRILKKIKLIDDDKNGLFFLDNEIGQRTNTAT